MFKKSKMFLAGFVCCFVIMSLMATVLAVTKSVDINVLYRDIKLYIDGSRVTPKDANGNTIEPFIYNGTTYLPVRAIGEAFNKTVSWNDKTSTIKIESIVEASFDTKNEQPKTEAKVEASFNTKNEQPKTAQPTTVQSTTVQSTIIQSTTAQPTTSQPATTQPATGQPANSSNSNTTKLTDLDYLSVNNDSHAKKWAIADEMRISTGDYLSDCLYAEGNANSYATVDMQTTIDYLINGQYKQISGKIFLEYNSRSGKATERIIIWGDGKMLYTSPNINAGFLPIDFKVDISGVNVLKIGAEFDKGGENFYKIVGISNATLTK